MTTSSPIRIRPEFTSFLLSALALLLVLSNGLVLYARFGLGDDYLGGLVPMFDLDMERNIPTLFQTVLLLAVSALLALTGTLQRHWGKRGRFWWLLAAIFCVLAVDEFVGIHEHLNRPLRVLIGASGFAFFAWVVPYGILVALLGATYFRFVMEMPRRTRRLVVIAFVTYIGGAIGFEMLGGWYFQLHGLHKDLGYGLLSASEESLEMAGLICFIHALLGYIGAMHGDLTLQIVGPSRVPVTHEAVEGHASARI